MKTLKIWFLFLLMGMFYKAGAQDTTDLMNLLEKEMTSSKDMTYYTTATFKTTRLVNGHSVENVAKGVLDVKISHRFGNLNEGFYELFGLDKATMRIGFDYGISNNLMIGVGRSTYQKTYDAFFKLKILRQSKGKRKMPITLSYVPTIAYRSLKWQDPSIKNYATSRLFYSHQLIIGRKFSEGTSFQLMPTFIHQNLVTGANDPIETGGHVFQLHFTNSPGMNERTFIADTKGRWDKGDILFGFNISRVFTIRNKH